MDQRVSEINGKISHLLLVKSNPVIYYQQGYRSYADSKPPQVELRFCMYTRLSKVAYRLPIDVLEAICTLVMRVICVSILHDI